MKCKNMFWDFSSASIGERLAGVIHIVLSYFTACCE
jgi:hypothetical protein